MCVCVCEGMIIILALLFSRFDGLQFREII